MVEWPCCHDPLRLRLGFDDLLPQRNNPPSNRRAGLRLSSLVVPHARSSEGRGTVAHKAHLSSVCSVCGGCRPCRGASLRLLAVLLCVSLLRALSVCLSSCGLPCSLWPSPPHAGRLVDALMCSQPLEGSWTSGSPGPALRPLWPSASPRWSSCRL